MKKFRADDPEALAADLKPSLDELEILREDILQKIISAKKRLAIAVILTLAVCISFLVYLERNVAYPIDYYIFLLIPILIGGFYCNRVYFRHVDSNAKNYQKSYKEKVIGGIASRLYDGMVFMPEGGISEDEFRESGLYPRIPDSYSHEDGFAGKVGKTEILFSEVRATERVTETDAQGKTRTRTVTIFNGLFLKADFNKNFNCWLTVKPDFAEKTFGWLGKKIQGFNPKLIQLENPEFEKAFTVHGSDQVEVRYILTPDLQERLLNLRDSYGKDIRISFKNSNIYIAISDSSNWYEPDIKLPAHDISQIKKFLNEMCFMFNLVYQLDLNTRIWSKH